MELQFRQKTVTSLASQNLTQRIRKNNQPHLGDIATYSKSFWLLVNSYWHILCDMFGAPPQKSFSSKSNPTPGPPSCSGRLPSKAGEACSKLARASNSRRQHLTLENCCVFGLADSMRIDWSKKKNRCFSLILTTINHNQLLFVVLAVHSFVQRNHPNLQLVYTYTYLLHSLGVLQHHHFIKCLPSYVLSKHCIDSVVFTGSDILRRPSQTV